MVILELIHAKAPTRGGRAGASRLFVLRMLGRDVFIRLKTERSIQQFGDSDPR